MSADKSRNKDIINFHHLCKDLYKYIQRRVIKRYVNPEMTYAQISNHNSLNNIIDEEKEWKYYNKDEKISEEEKILDIFKDDTFLSQIQKCYESLEIVISSLNENQKNIELLQKKIEIGEHKIQLLSQINTHLNQFFKSKENSCQIQPQIQIQNNNNNNINNNKNNKNVLDRLNLVKSLNILNDLQIFNSINDSNKKENINNINNSNSSNTTITNNNNIILDNKIINNNIGEHKNNEKIDLVSNNEENYSNEFVNNSNKKNDFRNNINYNLNYNTKLLNKKSKKEKKNDEEYNNMKNNHGFSKGKNSFNQNNQNNNNKKYNKNKNFNNFNKYNNFNNNKNYNSNNNNSNSKNLQLPNFNKEIAKNPISNSNSNSNINSINNSEEEENIINPNIPINEEINLDNKEEDKNNIEERNNENIEKENNKEDEPNDENMLEIEFEKVLKKEFSSIYSPEQKIESNKEIIREIKIVIKKIMNMKFHKENKFDDPYLIGSYSHFDLNNLLDYIPPIDILFKCKDIKSFEELKNIALETMQKKLCYNYIEISKDYDKQNEIVKMSNKCKIKLKYDNNIFIYINLFFVGINLSSYNKKEQTINRFFFSNNVYDNRGKILISLFFRRWRKKFKLYFIMPEFLDIIVNFYYNEKVRLSLTIENIFYDLFNGEINFNIKNDNISKDEENMKDISVFVNEWFNDKENQNMLSKAIISTQEYILKNDFYSTFIED